MRIDAERTGGSALLRLEGRLDREGAERLSDTLEDLLQEGVRSLRIDFSQVSYASSAVTRVLARWHEELAVLRGEVELQALSPAISELFSEAGWHDGLPPAGDTRAPVDRRSYWHARADFAASGQYELSAATPGGALQCRIVGDPAPMTARPLAADDCTSVSHTATRRCRLPGDKTNNRFFISIFLYPTCCFRFHTSTNFADHNDGICICIIHEKFNSFFGGCSNDRIAANPHSC